MNNISIRISAVTITKNEEENISRWIQSAKLYADEIIVLDTGSNDNTVAIAESAGIRVEHFKWINDFSAAKNYAIDLCTGHWIAFLDADEYFPEDDAKKVRPLLESLSPNLQIAGVITPLVNIDKDEHNRFISVFHQLRLFRRLADIRYQKPIHEVLTGINVKNRIIKFDESIQIFHTGYSSSIIRKKLTRNLSIIQSEIARNGHQAGDYYYLADCYYGLEEYEKAIEYATKHIDSGDNITADESSTYALRIASRALLKQPISKILPDINAGIKKFPNSAVFHFLAGNIYYQAKDYLTAAQWMDQGLQILLENKSKEFDPLARISGSNDGEVHLPAIYANRSTIFFLSGDYQNAINYSMKGLSIYRYNLTALHEFLQLMGKLQYTPSDIIERLNSIYGSSDTDYLCQAIFPFINRYKNLAMVYAQFAPKGMADTSSPLFSLALDNFPATIEESQTKLSRSLIAGIVSSLQCGISMQESPIRPFVTQVLDEAWMLIEKDIPLPGSMYSNPEVNKLLHILKNHKLQ